MKRKIYLNITLFASIAVLCVAILLLTIFYNFYANEQKKSLRAHSHIMADTFETLGFNEIEKIVNIETRSYRTTIIDKDGRVIFDSYEEPHNMENHIGREEIKVALREGLGESLRYSTTIGKDTYYYAIRLSNGSILRTSLDIENISSVFMKIIPGILLAIVSIMVIAFFVASILTQNILKPIEEATSNIESIIKDEEFKDINTYDELIPFVKAVSKQNYEINSYVRALKERAETIEVITASMKEGLILVDRNKNILSVNHGAIGMLGGKENLSYIGKNFIRLCRNIEINETLTETIEDLEGRDIIIKISDGYLNLFFTPIISGGIIQGAVILVVDATEKYQSEIARREFTSNVSHELKTPLTAIKGYAEMIEAGMAKDEDIKGFAGIIKEEGDRLYNLIDSIMRLSKIEESVAGEFSPTDLYSTGRNIIDKLGLEAANKGIELNIIGEETITNCNQTMIEELIYNLVDNGIKYTNSPGKVNIDIWGDRDKCYIRVADTGIGIPEKDQPRIFERFYTVDKSRSRKSDSTGLGLSIVKHIVEHHKGTIDLISVENEGTEILVTLPTLP